MSHLNLPSRIHEKPIEAKLTNLHMGGAKELSDVAIIQNPQVNVYYATKLEAKEIKEQMSKTKEKVLLTMYGLI